MDELDPEQNTYAYLSDSEIYHERSHSTDSEMYDESTDSEIYDESTDSESWCNSPKQLKTLISDLQFPEKNSLLHKFVMENSYPNNSFGENYISAVLLSMIGVKVNEVNENGLTALHLAVLANNDLMVTKLLTCLKDINIDKPAGIPKAYFDKVNKGGSDYFDSLENQLLGLGFTVNGCNICKNTALHMAVKEGYLSIVQILLANGAYVDSFSSYDFTPLYLAGYFRQELIVSKLLEAGADVNLTNKNDENALYSAIKSGSMEIVELLMNAGSLLTPSNSSSHLHCAVQCGYTEIVKFLICKGADVNALNITKKTPLHFAANLGYLEMCESLVSKGADVNAPDKNNDTPLHCATNLEIVKLLVNKAADIHALGKASKTPLHCAVKFVHLYVHEWLLRVGSYLNDLNKKNATPIHTAENLKIIKYLVSKGADVNTSDEANETPLHCAAKFNYLEICEFLVSRGADVNAVDEKNMTPLHCATNIEVVKLLISKGADLNALSESNKTPLHLAVESNNIELVHYFIAQGCCVNAKSKRGYTPLYFAAKLGNLDICNSLVKCGGKVKERFKSELLVSATKSKDVKMIEFAISIGGDVNCKLHGRTPLHFAAISGDLETVQILIAKGASVNACDKIGRTPLETAVWYFFLNVLEPPVIDPKELATIPLHKRSEMHLLTTQTEKEIFYYYFLNRRRIYNDENLYRLFNHVAALEASNFDVIKLLIESGGTMLNAYACALLSATACLGNIEMAEYSLNIYGNVNGEDDRYPLHYAVMSNDFQTVQYLVDKGANVNICDLTYKNPLLKAILSSSDLRIVNYLVECGADINSKDDDGITCLHYAVMAYLCRSMNIFDVVKFLLEKGIDINSKDNYGNTCLHFAVNSYSKRSGINVIKFLLEKGADINAKNNKNSTPLCSARRYFLPIVKHLVINGADINSRDSDGNTCLHYAVMGYPKRYNNQVIKYLLTKGGDVNVTNNNFLTPLSYTQDPELINILRSVQN